MFKDIGEPTNPKYTINGPGRILALGFWFETTWRTIYDSGLNEPCSPTLKAHLFTESNSYPIPADLFGLLGLDRMETGTCVIGTTKSTFRTEHDLWS